MHPEKGLFVVKLLKIRISMVSEHAKSITPEKAKKATIIFLDYLIEFAKSIDELRPDLDFFRPVMQLDELRMRLTSNGPALKNEYEVDRYLHEVVERMIHIDPKIEQQLTNYWKAQIQITTMSNKSSKDYHPQKLAEENYEQVTKIDKLYKYVKLKFNETPNEKSVIFGLFYIHILKTEVIEHSFRVQFEKLLHDFGLASVYDSKTIFSVKQKILKQRKSKKGNIVDDWVTDARAIRDALSHNRFELEFVGDNWFLYFNNHEHGYDFEMTFSKDEFKSYLTNTDILYRCTMMINFRIIAGTLIKLFYVPK